VSEIVRAARAAPKGSTVVVVGHSNTVPAIARALGYFSAPDIPDCRYDGLWMIHLDGKAAVATTYGAPSTGC
jgi:bisphosphoglycerate-dependent phosphoglycerate mutase